MVAKQNLSHSKFEKADFSGQDLRGVPMDHSFFICCNFDRANMNGVDCEHTNFSGSTFRDTDLGGANWKDCNLVGILFLPKDCYGITLTLQCQTFRGVRISQLWFFCWCIFASMMIAEPYPIISEPSWNDKLIALIGAERYLKLKALFARREI
jgi:hypothetical protein